MESILEYLNKHGEKMDIEISEATGLPLPAVRSKLRDMSLSGAVISYNVTKLIDSERIDGVSSRITGSAP